MGTEYANNLKISQSDLVEIYNTVPRTLFYSAIVVSVIQDLYFQEESSGNYWIIKIDNSTGLLFPKRGQIFDRYQYGNLQYLFDCSGYEQHSNKEFIVKQPARVTFNLDKKQWHSSNKGILEFGDNSPLTRLKKALEERERLFSDSQQDKREIENLHNELQKSQNIATQRKSEIAELKLDHTMLINSFAELQSDKKRQEERNNKLESSLIRERQKSEERQEKIDSIRQKLVSIPNKLESISKKNKQQFQNEISSAQQELDNIKNKLSGLNNQQSQFNQNLVYEYTKLTEESFAKNIPSIHNFNYASYPNSTSFLETLVIKYNRSPNKLAKNIIKVAATKESIEQRRSGIKTPLILKKNDNDSYWVILEERIQDDNYYLVPKANLIIGDRIYRTVEYIFTCQGYENKSSNNFILVRPAEVKFTRNQEFELLKPGELKFEQN